MGTNCYQWKILSKQHIASKENRSTEGCSKLKRSVDMTSSGKNGLNIRTNASPKWDRTRCPDSYEAEFIQSLLSTGKKKLASQFNFTDRYIDDILSINNPDFENYLGQIYPAELEIKDTTESNTSASYLDLLLSIESDGQLRTSLYHKRDDFNFHITNFPFLSSNIPSSPAYGVFISQLILYARACSSYACFILRAARLSSKLFRQGYVMERLKPSLRKFYCRYGDLIKHYEVSLSQMLLTFWDMTIYNDTLNWSDITPICEFITEWILIPILTLLSNFGGFHRTLQRLRLANRGRLHLRTPGPVPFGTCICSNAETILSWTCHVYGPFEFRTSLGTSIFLWCTQTYAVLIKFFIDNS